jgi:hypothetical protein
MSGRDPIGASPSRRETGSTRDRYRLCAAEMSLLPLWY